MTEADTESIWSTTLDTTRFGNIGVRIAEILNFEVNDDCTSQVTNTAVTPILEQISEEILIDLIAGSQGTDVVVPWDFINANFGNSVTKILRRWFLILKKVKKVLNRYKSIEIVTREL